MNKFIKENIKHSNLDKDLPSSDDSSESRKRDKIVHDNLDKTLSLSDQGEINIDRRSEDDDIRDMINDLESSEEDFSKLYPRRTHNNLNQSFEIYDEDNT